MADIIASPRSSGAVARAGCVNAYLGRIYASPLSPRQAVLKSGCVGATSRNIIGAFYERFTAIVENEPIVTTLQVDEGENAVKVTVDRATTPIVAQVAPKTDVTTATVETLPIQVTLHIQEE